MIAGLRRAMLALVALTLLAAGASAQTLYAVSVRKYSDPGSKGIEGNLYKVDPRTGATTLLSNLTVDGTVSVGLDGLAVHPGTGIFYGITASNSAVIPNSLVKVDPETGRVSRIGDLGLVGSDIDFDKDGKLFVWIPNTRQLGIVNLATGAVTPRGQPVEGGAPKGAFTVIGGGVALATATGATGTLDTVDMATGVVTTGPHLVGAPFPELITGLADSPQGELFAINADFGTPSSAYLVTIDRKTGQVTKVGPLPSDTDALAFGPSIADPSAPPDEVPRWRLPVIVAMFLLALVFLAVVMWPRKKQ